MAIYVDTLRPTITTKRWPYRAACHLYADTVGELHRAAGALRLDPAWFHNREDMPHYDLTANKRDVAVRLGAVTTSTRHIVKTMQRRRRARLKAEAQQQEEIP